jgi:hypothetical protein
MADRQGAIQDPAQSRYGCKMLDLGPTRRFTTHPLFYYVRSLDSEHASADQPTIVLPHSKAAAPNVSSQFAADWTRS